MLFQTVPTYCLSASSVRHAIHKDAVVLDIKVSTIYCAQLLVCINLHDLGPGLLVRDCLHNYDAFQIGNQCKAGHAIHLIYSRF